MRAIFPRLCLMVGASALLLQVGCGGCDDDDVTFDAPPNIDARIFDAAPDAVVPDADPADLRSGTIAVTEVKLTNDLTTLGVAEVRGAAVSISFIDLTAPGTDPVVGSGGIGECTVWVYDVGTDPVRPPVDEGAVSISGTGVTPNAFPPCVWVEALNDYKCFGKAPTAAPDPTVFNYTIVGTPPAAQVQTTFTAAGADFQTMSARGMWLNTTGFTHPVNNGAMAILAPPAESTAVVANFAASGCINAGLCTEAEIDETHTAGTASYTVLAGEAPIPGFLGATPPANAGFDFLGDEASTITVAKAGGAVLPEFSVTIHPSGNGLTLAPTSAQPHQFPSTTPTGGITFDCGDTGGNCGTDGEGELIVGFVVSGSTTDGSLTTGCNGGPCLPIQMPAATTQYAEFQCRGLPGATSIDMPEAALDAILGTNPTRIETRVLRISANLTDAPPTNVVAGYGLVGYSNIQ